MALPRNINTFNGKAILDIVPGLSELAEEKGRIEVYLEGQQIIEQGEPLARLVIPLNANVTLLKISSVSGKSEPIGFLQKGRSACLRQLLNNEPAPYSVRADKETMVLSIPGVPFRELVLRNEGLAEYLDLMTSSPGARRFKGFLSEANIAFEEIVRIISKMSLNPISVQSGDHIQLAEPRLVFIERGMLLAKSKESSEQQFEAVLGEGQWCGGESIVPPYDAQYKLTALRETQLRFLELRAIKNVIQELELIDEIHSDPWVKKNRRNTKAKIEQELSPISGREVSPQWAKINIPGAGSLIAGCKDDSESTEISVLNACRLVGVEMVAPTLRSELNIARKMTFGVIGQILDRHGVDSTALQTTAKLLYRHVLPALIVIGNRMVVLVAANPKQVFIHDPARGLMELSLKELDERWNGQILEFERSELDVERASAFKEIASTAFGAYGNPNQVKAKLVIRSIVKTLQALMVFLPTCLSVIFVFVLAGIVSPKIYGYLIDAAMLNRDPKSLGVLFAGSFLILLFNSGMIAIMGSSFGSIQERFDRKLHKMLYRHLFMMPASKFPKDIVGDVHARFGALHSVAQFVGNASVGLGINIVMCLLYCGMLSLVNVNLALVNLAVFPVVALVRVVYRGRFKKHSERLFEASKSIQSLLTEQLTSIQAIKACGAERAMRERWENSSIEITKMNRIMTLESASVEGLVGITGCVAQTLGLSIAVVMALKGSLSIGSVLMVNVYSGALFANVMALAHAFEMFERIKVSMNKVSEVISAAREEEPDTANNTLSFRFTGKIRFDNVSFRYEKDGPWVLDGIDLTIYPQQKVAIVGASGCGKTTFAQLIAGTVTPNLGRIIFDDVESNQISLWCRRQQIGLIAQNSRLFGGSFEENITMGDDCRDEIEMRTAAANAGAADFIENYINQYHYNLAEGGTGLSGGQAQRVAIARVLYRDPKILIFDEATASLDADTERLIVDRMESYLKGRTAIVIAHRLSTVRNADRIIVLKKGKVVGDGTHSDLVQSCEHYNELFFDQANVGMAA